MAVAVNTKKIEDWFSSIQGYKVVLAVSAMTPVQALPEVSLAEVIALAQDCDWIEFDDMLDTPYAKSGFMHPEGLNIGWGNPDDAFSGKAGTGVLFFNAYRI